MSSKCDHCGAAIGPVIPARFDSIGGCTVAKRGAEIALAGGHSISFVALGSTADAEVIAAAIRAYAGDRPGSTAIVRVVAPCPCGGFNSRTRECTCTPEAIKLHMRRPSFKAALMADICIEVGEPYPGERHFPEPDEHIMERVYAAATLAEVSEVSRELPADCARLWEHAIARLGFGLVVQAAILQVAATIARLGGSAVIEAAHLAEAVQYKALDRVYRA